MLYDLGGVDERERLHREGMPDAAFSVFYHLVSYGRNADVRLKVALPEDEPRVDSVAGVWPAADWYERELWDMFGVGVAGHTHLHRLLMPPWWDGHPLRKEHPSRGTEYGPFDLPDQLVDAWQEQLRFKPEEWDLPRTEDDPTLMYLNIGPQHGATHGPFRVVVGLRDEEIVHLDPGHRLPPPRLGEAGRAPELAHLHPVHGPRGLPRRRHQQPALRALGGEALRHRGAGQGAAHPRAALRVLPHRQPPRLLRHLRAGHRRALAGLLHVRGQGDPVRRRHRAHHRRAHAPQLVPHRRGRRGPAGGLEAARARLLRLPPAAARRVRQARDGQPHRQGADGRGRAHLRGRGRGLGADRPDAARGRPALGLAQAAPVQPLRLVRLRRARSAPPATATTAPPCTSRRCARACASCARSWTPCPTGRTRRTTRWRRRR